MADPQDARGVLVTLSAAGVRRLAEVRSHRTALVARRLRRLDAGQRASLVAALPALEALLVGDDPTDDPTEEDPTGGELPRA